MTPATTIDHENAGTSARRISGVRRAITVVATQAAARRMAMITRPMARRLRADGVGVHAAHRTAVEAVAQDEEDGAAQPGPEGTGRRPREGQAGGPDLQRHDGGGQAEEEGHDDEERQAEPVEGEDLQDVVAAEHLELVEGDRLEVEQRADHDGHDQEERRPAEPQPTDRLVVARAHDGRQAAGFGLGRRRGLGGRGRGCLGHGHGRFGTLHRGSSSKGITGR